MVHSKAAMFVDSLMYEGLAERVKGLLPLCVLDGLGVAIAGTQTETSKCAAAFVESEFNRGPATLLQTGAEVSLSGAAFGNVVAANALDADDGYRPAKGHPGAFLIMPALNCCQALGDRASGEELLCGIAAGYEVAMRAAVVTHRHYRHYHASGSWGATGTAALVGKLLGLDAEAMDWALGLGEYHAALSPIERCLTTPAMTKDGIAWGAHAGMCAALLAREGFTGNPSLFFDEEYADVHDDFGDRWRVLELYFKPCTCCRWAQPGVDGVLKVMAAHELEAAEIERIEFRTFAEAASLSHELPTNTEQAQYNIPWPLAAAAVCGTVGPEQVLPPAFDDPEIKRLARTVVTHVDEQIQQRFPAECLGEVVIHTRDGKEYDSGLMPARGDADRPLTRAELADKFVRLVTPVLGRDAAEELVELVAAIASPDGPQRLWVMLKPALLCRGGN